MLKNIQNIKKARFWSERTGKWDEETKLGIMSEIRTRPGIF